MAWLPPLPAWCTHTPKFTLQCVGGSSSSACLPLFASVAADLNYNGDKSLHGVFHAATRAADGWQAPR